MLFNILCATCFCPIFNERMIITKGFVADQCATQKRAGRNSLQLYLLQKQLILIANDFWKYVNFKLNQTAIKNDQNPHKNRQSILNQSDSKKLIIPLVGPAAAVNASPARVSQWRVETSWGVRAWGA